MYKVKFIGDFKELIPMGFKFMKLFASNYKVYRKERTWVWVAQGGYVEYSDFGTVQTAYIFKKVLDGTYPVYDKDTWFPSKPPYIMFKKSEPKSCVINEEGNIIAYDKFCKLHCHKFNTLEKYWDWKFDSGWRELFVHQKEIDVIKEIAHMIEIKEVE